VVFLQRAGKKVGQRWIFTSESSRFIAEIISIQPLSQKIIQAFKGYYVLGQETTFPMIVNNWEYLEGQDKPV
jgi:hypothetical protein